MQRLTAYAYGQPLTAGQKDYVRQLQDDFAKNGYRLQHLMRTIALSPEFFRAARPTVTLAANR